MRVWEIIEGALERRQRLDRARQKRTAALSSYQEAMRSLGATTDDVQARRAAAAAKYQSSLKRARESEAAAMQSAK
tara:strand:- start:250 stop:477 length:228 start_codon:yes stop_codon:yes gene_type:complete